MKQIVVIGVVIVLIAAVAFVFLASPAKGSDEIEGDLTVYIEDMETGEVHAATLSISKLSFTESAMLSFGQNIRTTEMQPMFTYTTKEPIKQLSYYNVWTVARINVQAEDITTLTTNAVHFSAEINTPIHGHGLFSSRTADKVVDAYGYLKIGQDVVVDMATDLGKKWTHKIMDGATQTSGIQGHNLDKMYLHCQVLVGGTDATGKAYAAETYAKLTITVKDWAAAILTVSIKDMGVGSDSPAVSIMPMMIGMTGILGAISMASHRMDN